MFLWSVLLSDLHIGVVSNEAMVDGDTHLPSEGVQK